MKQLLAAIAAAAVVSTGLVAASAPTATAGTSHSGSGATLDAYNLGHKPGAYSCVNVGKYTLSVDADKELSYLTDYAEYESWSADITVTKPDGTSEGDYLFGDGGYSSDSNTVFMCGIDKWRGTYHVEADISIDGWDGNCDSDPNCYDGSISTTDYVSGQFRVGVAPTPHRDSITNLRKVRHGLHGWLVTAHVNRNGKPWKHRSVHVQRRMPRGWVNVRTLHTGPRGLVRYTGFGPGKRRFHIAKRGLFPARSSRIFRIHRRR